MSFDNILKRINNLSSDLREEIIKNAQAEKDNSLFPYGTAIEEGTREKRLREGLELHQKYNLTPPEKSSDLNNSDALKEQMYKQPTLSTRYAPDMPGVQALRVSENVFQNPYSGKIYDYNEGFEVDGVVYSPGSPSLQTDIMTLAKEFKVKGLVKEARLLKLFLEELKK